MSLFPYSFIHSFLSLSKVYGLLWRVVAVVVDVVVVECRCEPASPDADQERRRIVVVVDDDTIEFVDINDRTLVSLTFSSFGVDTCDPLPDINDIDDEETDESADACSNHTR